MSKIKVIFDTDPGVDDAMALLFLKHSPEIELVGITTTLGNGTIATTTRNALYLVERFGIDVPVAQGPATPLVGPAGDPPHYVHGHNAIGDIELPETIARTVDPRPAHRLIIDLIRENPGEIAIVAVGRMTNLALALREAPEIAGLVKQVVIMGGAFGFHGNHGNVTPAAEANIAGDPLAADEVAGGSWPVTWVGLDVTQRTQLSTEYLEALAKDGGEAGRFIWDITRVYVAYHHAAGVENMFVHDSSAVAYLLDPTLFTTRSGAIRVITEGMAVGQTIQKPDSHRFPPGDWDNRPSHRICTEVDSERFKALYRQTILRGA
ncbi:MULTISPECIES: nucleoside hydrolase [Kaistia]|uniref:Nucleoside hydrolase n=1 Tax=Kaistia nematophila TaxID=2994654 RepID=A0A9X3DY36_9HYPH|nr:nucleoside hydrolase [Kaistia nematophila]MBN9025918.1 nucleoside hydrolase [Hyphomicrobiales bacterium]MCX5567571.1 nucleoside hydrolase [Kaistia nematophila]